MSTQERRLVLEGLLELWHLQKDMISKCDLLEAKMDELVAELPSYQRRSCPIHLSGPDDSKTGESDGQPIVRTTRLVLSQSTSKNASVTDLSSRRGRLRTRKNVSTGTTLGVKARRTPAAYMTGTSSDDSDEPCAMHYVIECPQCP